MLLGELVRLRKNEQRGRPFNLGLGIILGVNGNYRWVRFQGQPAENVWLHVEDLEVIK